MMQSRAPRLLLTGLRHADWQRTLAALANETCRANGIKHVYLPGALGTLGSGLKGLLDAGLTVTWDPVTVDQRGVPVLVLLDPEKAGVVPWWALRFGGPVYFRGVLCTPLTEKVLDELAGKGVEVHTWDRRGSLDRVGVSRL